MERLNSSVMKKAGYFWDKMAEKYDDAEERIKPVHTKVLKLIGPVRIYLVEQTGPIEDDPNLTNKKFRGNPTKSFRSREPLWVVG